jgi:hypothetical protein
VELQFNEASDSPDSLIDEVMTICPPEEFEDYYRKSLKKSLSKASPKLSLWWG